MVGNAEKCTSDSETPSCITPMENKKMDKEFASKDTMSDCGEIDKIIVPKADHYLAIATFSLFGITQLLIWNMIINISVALSTIIWPGNVSLDVLGGTEHAFALVTSLAMLKLNGLSRKGAVIWTAVNSLFYLIFPLIPQLLHGNEHYSAAKGLLVLVCAALGCCAGMMHVYGYAFASILPTNYVAWVSTGNGLAGAYSFIVFTILSEAVFAKDMNGQLLLTWIFFITGTLLGLVQIVCFWKLSGKDWFKASVILARKKKEADLEAALKQWGEPRSVMAVIKDCIAQALNASLTLFFTLLIFPACGPFGWGKGYTVTSSLNGAFQIVDLILRWLPTLGGWTRIPKKWLWLFVLCRPLIFVPLFVVPSRLQDIAFLSTTPWLFVIMILFTLTNGWFVTCGCMYCPDCVDHPAEKEIAAEVLVTSLLSFITLGIYASKIPML